jgi:acetyl-CoA carboxylase carboxyl transferase subunit alpha
MLENAIYSVITPEACASITWRDAAMKARAATALKPAAQDMLRLGLIDEVIAEPEGGAHNDVPAAARGLADALERQLQSLDGLTPKAIIQDRYNRFRTLGQCFSL